MAEAVLIEAAHLACRRGERTLFEDLTFALTAGDALLLRGPNGTGKSSLLRILAGFLPAAGGDIKLAGERFDPRQAARYLAYAGHANPLKPALSVAGNVAFLQALAGDEEGEAMLSAFGLNDIADMPARYLSSGQRRRATLAACLSPRRPIWLLDEPGVGLDRLHRQSLERMIDTHLAKGGVVIAASHGDIELTDPLVLDFGENPQ